jgi:DnaJ domain
VGWRSDQSNEGEYTPLDAAHCIRWLRTRMVLARPYRHLPCPRKVDLVYNRAVASIVTLLAWADSLDSLSYYRILRVPPTAAPAQVKKAFHDLAVHCHPDQYQDEAVGARAAAERIFKASVEAYSILSNKDLRARYDAQLKEGKLRLDPSLPVAAAPTAAAPVPMFALATTPDGRKFAAKAQAHLEANEWEPARLALTDACQREPGNAALKDRLRKLYNERP